MQTIRGGDISQLMIDGKEYSVQTDANVNIRIGGNSFQRQLVAIGAGIPKHINRISSAGCIRQVLAEGGNGFVFEASHG